jgi:hypothetical protein
MEDSLKRRGIKIKAGDLMPWFLQDHDTLPQWYLDDTKKFFEWLGGRVGPKATSSQAKIKLDS